MAKGWIVQMIPAVGWRAVFAVEDGKNYRLECVPLVAFVLQRVDSQGDAYQSLRGATVEDTKFIEWNLEETSNFLGYANPEERVETVVTKWQDALRDYVEHKAPQN